MSNFLRKYKQLLTQTKGSRKANECMKIDEQHSLQVQVEGFENRQQSNDDNLLKLTESNSYSADQKQRYLELISYRIQGNSIDHHVSDLYLQQKLNTIINEGNKHQHIQDVYQQQPDKRPRHNKTPRYFEEEKQIRNQGRFIRCYRCYKRGHTQKHCPQSEETNRCLNCLGDHNQNSCNMKACFQCNLIGHIAKDCPMPKVMCSKCGYKGHLEQSCGVIVFANYQKNKNSDREFRSRYTFNDLVSLRCLASCKYPVGHFNCYEYQHQREQCYSEAKVQKTLQRQKFILSNMNKLRQNYFKQVSKLGRPKQTVEYIDNSKLNYMLGEMQVQSAVE